MKLQVNDSQSVLAKKAFLLSDTALMAILHRYERKFKIDDWYCVCCEEAERRREAARRQYLLFD